MNAGAPLDTGAAAFRAAMARFPSGVVVATTLDANKVSRGFTASAFCSVSLDPPLVLVCLGRDAECHVAFAAAERLAISILAPGQDAVALRFATRGADKFAGEHMADGPGGLPVVREAAAVLDCRLQSALPGGDHTILLCAVRGVTLAGEPGAGLVHHARRFWTVGEGGLRV